MRNVDPALPGVALNQSVNDPSRDDYDTAEELQERAELAAELEALLDAAAASGEDSDIQESLQPLQSGQDIDMADKGHEESPDAGGDSAEDSSAVYSDSDQENESPPRSPHQSISAEIHQGPLIFSPADRHIQPPAEIHQGPLIFSPADRHIQPPAEIHEGPLIFSPADRHIQPEVAEPSTPPQKRVKRIPVSPIKKFVAQQFLNQSRDQLRALAQARGMFVIKAIRPKVSSYEK